MTVVLAILNVCGRILPKIIWFLLQYLLYPVKAVYNLTKILFFDNKSSILQKGALVSKTFICLGLWSVVAVILLTSFDIQWLFRLGGTVVVGQKEGFMKYTPHLDPMPDDDGDSGNGGDTDGEVDFDGENYIIDLENLPDEVPLPSGYYQYGSVRQRAEILLLAIEISNRPEITLTPDEICGIWYVEMTGGGIDQPSIIQYTAGESYNGSGAGGPFQHTKENWWSNDTQVNGKAFISKLEDEKLSDNQRVRGLNECDDLKTPNGLDRPNMFYMPDAMYTAALRVSNSKQGLYRGIEYSVTKPVFDWLKTKSGLSGTQKDQLKYSNAVNVYSGYLKDCCNGFVPCLYHDMIKDKGSLNQWSDKAVSRGGLIGTFSGDPYSEGSGLVGSTVVVSNIAPNGNSLESGKSYTSYWQSTGNVHLPSHYYGWTAINGGEWIFDGLQALGAAVGEEVVDPEDPDNPGDPDNPDRPPGEDIEGYTCPMNLSSYVITSRFHEDRGNYSHRGTDVDGVIGDKLYASRDGVVTTAGVVNGGGKAVYIDLDNGVESVYMHMNKIYVKVGQKVKKGECVGEVGNTGAVKSATGDGSHLHIELWRNGKEFNSEFLFNPKTYW